MRVIFLGGKSYGVGALRFLVVNWDVIAIDGDDLIKTEARRLEIPLLGEVELGRIDLLISYLYKKRVREPLLSYPRLGCVNFHPGWLPEFAGACGYNVAILEGAHQYGCTAHFMTDQIDGGDIIARRAVYLDWNETAYSLAMKTYEEMFWLLNDVVRSFELGSVKRIPQTNTRYMKWAEVEKLRYILPEDDAKTIDRKTRAFYFPPYKGAERKDIHV